MRQNYSITMNVLIFRMYITDLAALKPQGMVKNHSDLEVSVYSIGVHHIRMPFEAKCT